MRWLTSLLILATLIVHPVRAQEVMVVEALGGPDGANADIVEQLRPLVNVELGFIKRVCDPTDEQKQKIAAAVEESLEAMSDIVGAPQGPFGRVGGRVVMARAANGQELKENPSTRIRRDLAETIRPLLSEQQFADYETELEKRDQFRREAAVSMAVELLDRHLALTDDQRLRITERLLEKWQGAENLSMQTYVNNPQYVPPVPEVVVQPELDDAQMRAWKSLNKVQFPIQLSNNRAAQWDEDFLE